MQQCPYKGDVLAGARSVVDDVVLLDPEYSPVARRFRGGNARQGEDVLLPREPVISEIRQQDHVRV